MLIESVKYSNFNSSKGQHIQLRRVFPNCFKIQIKIKKLFIYYDSQLLDSPEMTPGATCANGMPNVSPKWPGASSKEYVTLRSIFQVDNDGQKSMVTLSTQVILRRKLNSFLNLIRRLPFELIYEHISSVSPPTP